MTYDQQNTFHNWSELKASFDNSIEYDKYSIVIIRAMPFPISLSVSITQFSSRQLAASLSLLFALFGLLGCKAEKKASARNSSPPVEATQAKSGSLPLVERLSGTVWAENQVVLYSEISGRIAEVLVSNGQSVTSGQALVRLSDESAREQVRQAEAGLRIEEARLRQSTAAFAEVEAQSKRIKSLSDRNLVTEVELETTAAQRESAAADVELAEARVEQAASNLAESRDSLTKTIIKAPIAGIVGVRAAEIGMQVTASTRLFTIGNLDRVTVRIDLTDEMLNYIEPGQAVQVFSKDADQDPLVGTLTRISPFLNPVARSTVAEIDLNNTERRLQPGMFAAVDILYGQSQQSTLVPSSALYTDSNTGREGVYHLQATPEADPENSLSMPVDVSFLHVDPIARGAAEVAISELEVSAWVVTLGQNLLATGRSQARVRSVTWQQVLDLQNLQRESLLEEVMNPKKSPRK